jgi:predicted AAA+ superfamily ATPase
MNTRFLFSSILERIPRDERTIIITGPRQSGKTTLMKQIKTEPDKKNLATFFFNLEDREGDFKRSSLFLPEKRYQRGRDKT